MAASAKALSLAAELKNALEHRGFVCSQSFDTDGAPMVRVGSNPAAGQQTALIKVKQLDPLGVDAIGLAARGYTPHIAQVVMETSTIANISLVVDSTQLAIFGELGKRDLTTELYMSANGNATGPEDILAGNLKATFYGDVKWKQASAQ